MKRCYQCGQTLPLTSFGRDRSRPGGLRCRCRSCETKQVYERKKRNGKRTSDEAIARWRAKNPERTTLMKKGRSAVQYALLRGVIQRASACEECGAMGRIEAAHRDYTRPLDVRWLCPHCHRLWDKAEPKSAMRGAAA